MADPAGPRATWSGSTITEGQIAELWERGALPPPDLVACRVPSAGEIVPTLEAGERAVLTSHLARGFGLPARNFLWCFLDHFGIQM